MPSNTHLQLVRVLILTAGFWVAPASPVPAKEYQGAAAVLQQALNTNGPANSSEVKISPARQLRVDLKAFGEKSAALPPSVAATQWLGLVDRFASLGDDRSFQGMDEPVSINIRNLVEVMPGPAAWPDLAREVDARPSGEGADAVRQLGLRFFVHTLTHDTAQRTKDLAAIEKMADTAKNDQAYVLTSFFDQLSRPLLATMDNPGAVLQSLERQLAAQQSGGYRSSLEIPDLVAIVGPTDAEAFLRKALVQSKSGLSIDSGTETRRLAQKIALELVNNLQAPQWSLVNSLDAVDLYEALNKRFAVAPVTTTPESDLPGLAYARRESPDYEKQSARIYYFLGLIAQGRTTNALVVAREFEKEDNLYFPGDVIRQMERAGFTAELNRFFHDLLQQNPELPLWDEYVQLAAHAGDTATMVNLVRTTVDQANLSKHQRTHLRHLLYTALLANDDVDAGVDDLRRLINSDTNQSGASRNDRYETRAQMALKLARIGHLLNRTNWMEEGIAATHTNLNHPADMEFSYWDSSTTLSFAAFLEGIGRGPEAEAVLASALIDSRPAADAAASQGRNQMAQEYLAGLVRLYSHAGRSQDVLLLFNQAPFWGGKDLAQVQIRYSESENWHQDYSFEHVSTPLGYYAADALAKTGRPAEARKLLDALFVQSPGCDRLYELLLRLDDQQAPAELDIIFARDQFEERPLIWKAHWLRQHQQLEEAEKTVRRAIAIDPTDGEEGRGDRLRAYAELADIRAARGDEKEATALRGAVQAVRQAELADQFHSVDMLKHAIELYTDSLNRFADAYCIHARLAVQLSDLGRHEEAAEHYRRAYELMPDSFGRVESHCFGCERAFDGERAQSIAETVFIQLAKKTPNKPQVHYLLGYLREEQARYPEALQSYRTAVKLDPDYLNAWVKMQSIDGHVFIPSSERDEVAFNILRLDPLHHRLTPSFELVSNLPSLWMQVAAAEKMKPGLPDSLYPLAASAAELAKQSALAGSRRDEDEMYMRRQMLENQSLTPARAISQNGFIQASLLLIGNRPGNAEID